MRARVGAAGAVAALALSASAFAQQPALPVGNFGGGTVVAPPRDPLGAGNVVIGMRSIAGGKLQMEATVRGKCGGGTFPAKATLAADGSFRAKGTNKRAPETGLRLKTTFDITGTLTASGVQDGVASAATEIRIKGSKTQTCASGKVPFQARRASGEIGTPGAIAKARYYGNTSERRHSAKRGFVMRISSDGTKLTRALYGVTLKCDKRAIPDIVDTPRRSLVIDSSGTVVDNVKSTFKDAKTVTKSDERFQGTLGSVGAKGTLSITEVTKNRKTGKLIETCKTGTISWTAAL
ncbi:MAG: hypothetical protein QOG15_795 [Solirubrobacteraceae bacterium]|jgi:hypothetical protein|nr:hypothetical protein [Solirubrobacteraceae bacterium]